MKIPRVVFFMARLCFAIFVLLTASYCLLAYIPFTYQQIHIGGLLPWLSGFVKYHPCIYWAAFLAAALTIWPDLHHSEAKLLSAAFLLFYGGSGVVLAFHPLLAGLENNTRSVFWGLAALLPLVWVAAIDWLGHGRYLVWSEPSRSEKHRIFYAVWGAALFLSLLYTAIFYLRQIVPGSIRFDGERWLLSLSWTVVCHLLVFTVVFLILSHVEGVGSLFVNRARVEFFSCSGLAVLLVWATIKFMVFPPVSFTGNLASIVALSLASSIVLFCTGLSVRLYRAEEGPIESGLALLLMPMRFLRCASRPAQIWFILLIPGMAYYLAAKTAAMDWEFVLQKLAVLFIWALTFAAFYTIAYATQNEGRTGVLFVVASATLGAYMTLLVFQPQWQAREEGGEHSDGIGLLDEYSDYDVSFRLVYETLSRSSTRIFSRHTDAESFYGFLAENTNIPRSTRVDPVDVKLVSNLVGRDKRKPSIFLFVIDSLRRDYLSPFNSAVTFTPSIEAFARESVAMQNAFTQYGGTGLSEPSIWVGGMMLHKQYVTPFYPMNALQKLLEAERYRIFVSKDEILSTVMAPSASVIQLDEGTGTMYYDFCRTLTELREKITGWNDPTVPLFAYTQPQNIHVSVINREGRSVPQGEKYASFDAPYASRIRRMDRCFGDFIQFLKQRSLYDDSIIILTADHGDSLGERGRMGHAYTIFPEVIRIPLIIHLPSRLGSTLSFNPRSLAFLTDITPTLYYLLGHKPIARNSVFGRPLFMERSEEQAQYLRDEYLIVSSYAPVYGILKDDGRFLYIADGVSYKDYFYDLAQGPGGMSKPTTDSLRTEYQRLIRKHILDINRFYRFGRP